jgi:hypothetical protein
VFGGTVARTTTCMHEEVDRWGSVIEAAGVTVP